MLLKKLFIILICLSFSSTGFAKVNVKKATKRKSASEEHAFNEEIKRSNIEIEDKKWGRLYIETTDFNEPANYSVEIKVFVECRDQKKVKSSINKPQKELLVHHKEVCFFDSHKFDQKTGKLSIFYNEDSGLGDSYEELCKVAKAQDFTIAELCKKWAP